MGGIVHCPKEPRPSPPKSAEAALLAVSKKLDAIEEDMVLMREGEAIARRQEEEERERERTKAKLVKSVKTQVELQAGISAGIYGVAVAFLDGPFWHHPSLLLAMLGLNLAATAIVNAARRYP